KSCDEFMFYESLVGRELGGAALDGAQAREQLSRALRALQQQGALPVFASKLKQTMVALDSTFNEANLGHEQFAGFLRATADLVDVQHPTKLLAVVWAGARTRPPPAFSIGLSTPRELSLPLSEVYRLQLRRAERLVVEPRLRQTLLGELHDLLAQPD